MTAPKVAVLRLPATGFERVSVAVTVALSTSLTTMSTRFSAVSSVYVSAAPVVVVSAVLPSVPLVRSQASPTARHSQQ